MSRGYELSKKEHILALQSDQDLIKEALRPLANRENSIADFPFKLKDGEWAMAHSESLQATSVSVEYHGLLKYIFNIYIYGNIRFCP